MENSGWGRVGVGEGEWEGVFVALKWSLYLYMFVKGTKKKIRGRSKLLPLFTKKKTLFSNSPQK